MSTDFAEAIVLADADYDEHGWPLARISISRRSYSLEFGACSCWLAEFDGLPGYYGEGVTPERALVRLRQNLGERPHFRVNHEFRKPAKLEADIRRRHDAMWVAAKTRADAFGWNRGGGEGVDRAAKEAGVGKAAANEARRKLSAAIDLPDGRRVPGVSKEALEVVAAIAPDKRETEIWIARQTPWRIEHAEAREKFPSETTELSQGPDSTKSES